MNALHLLRTFHWPLVGLILLVSPACLARTILMLSPDEENERLNRLATSVESQLTDWDVQLKVLPISRMPNGTEAQVGLAHQHLQEADALAVFWCDFERRAIVHIYYFEGDEARVLTRELGQSDIINSTEAVAVILRAFVRERLSAGEEEETEVLSADNATVDGSIVPLSEGAAGSAGEGEKAEKAAISGKRGMTSKARTSVETQAPYRLGARITYLFYSHSRQIPAASGVGLGVDFWFHSHFGVFAEYFVLQTLHTESKGLVLQVKRHPAALGLCFSATKGHVGVGGSLSVFIDQVTFRTFSTKYDLIESGDNDDLRVGGSLAFEVFYQLSKRWFLFFSGGIELVFNGQNYVVKMGRIVETMAEPFPVQPLMQIGMRVDLF